MKKKVIAYYFRSESNDSYLNIDVVDESTEALNVVDAMEKFGWDGGVEGWMTYCECNTKEELLNNDGFDYNEFIVKEKLID